MKNVYESILQILSWFWYLAYAWQRDYDEEERLDITCFVSLVVGAVVEFVKHWNNPAIAIMMAISMPLVWATLSTVTVKVCFHFFPAAYPVWLMLAVQPSPIP